MRRILACVLLLHVGLGLAATRDVDHYFFNQTFGDLKSELATAKAEGKTGVLLMYEQAECPFCAFMKRNVLNQSAVQDYYRKHFLIFSMDIRGSNPITDFSGKETTERMFSRRNRARATPTFVFYDLRGHEMARFTGVTKNAHEFLLLGRYVVDGGYKKEPFTRYKQGK